MGTVSLVKAASIDIQDQTPDVEPQSWPKPAGYTTVVVLIHAAYAAMLTLSGITLVNVITHEFAMLPEIFKAQAGIFALLAVLFLIRSFHRPGRSRKALIGLNVFISISMIGLAYCADSITPPSSTDGCMSGISAQTKEVSPYLIDGNIDVWAELYAPAPSGGGLNADTGPGPYQPPCPPE